MEFGQDVFLFPVFSGEYHAVQGHTRPIVVFAVIGCTKQNGIVVVSAVCAFSSEQACSIQPYLGL